MAGGAFAAEVACLQCLFDDRRVVRAERIFEGVEADRYRCEAGHGFGLDWPKPAPEPQWPAPPGILAGLDD